MQLNSRLKAGYDISRQVLVVPREVLEKSKMLSVSEVVAPAHPESAVCAPPPAASKLLFPDRQYNDEFLRTMSSVVRWSRRCGALGGGGSRAERAWAGAVAALLAVIVVLVSERLLRELASWTVRTNDGGAVSSSTAGLAFYLNAIGTVALSWRLGAGWRRLAARWAAAERALAAHAPPPPATLRRDMLAVIAVVSLGSLVEHVMSVVSAVGLDCSARDLLRCYTLASHGFIIAPGQYRWWWGALVAAVSNVATVLWNLQDLLVVLLGLGLSSRYRRLNAFTEKIVERCERLDKQQPRGRSAGTARPLWRAAREGFARQAALVRHVDEAIGPLILLSFLNNFYFICLQMFHGIASVQGVIQRCYFMLSLFWLCARAAGVVLAASAVHHHSREALTHTHACPSHYYTIEVHRLQTQLSRDEVALTGMRFFEITRSFLLKVTGAIITYEIVLVQFDDNECDQPPT